VTGWQAMAMKSALLAELDVPDFAVERLKRFLEAALLTDGRSKYVLSGPQVTQGCTAVNLLCRMFHGYDLNDESIRRSADVIRRWGPDLNDEYYTYHATYCMFQMGTGYWEDWNASFRDGAVARQIKRAGPLCGSWDPDPEFAAWGDRGGRVYVTCMWTLALEVYYRYLPVYR
jgi:hypothetical protein